MNGYATPCSVTADLNRYESEQREWLCDVCGCDLDEDGECPGCNAQDEPNDQE